LDSWSSYIHYGYTYRIDEIKASIQPAANYILSKHLFRSVRTGEIIEPSMLKFPFPYGWRYDILRALDCLRKLDVPYDPRMEEALDLLEQRFRRNGCLLTDSPLPRARHFRYDKTGKPNRFNTLRALRIFKKYRYQIYETMMDMSINDV
ncbi:MAG: hypothetical protein M0R05_07460, partial [Bacilli bacterium]|nr:hypothetical protein [Bacilli bacterium]